MVETDECPNRAITPSALARRASTFIPPGSGAARSGRSARGLAAPGKHARQLAPGTCASRKNIGPKSPGFGRTGTLACPPVDLRHRIGQTGVFVLPCGPIAHSQLTHNIWYNARE